MTRAKPWRQSGTVSWSVSSSSFGVLLFCKLEKEDIEVLLKSSKCPQSPLFAFLIFLWDLDSLHFFEAVGSAIDQLDDKPKLAMPSAPEEVEPNLPRLKQTLFSSNRKWKNMEKMWKMNGKDAMQQYRIHMNGLNKWFWRQNMASLRQWSESQSFYVFGALVIVLGLESLYIHPWMVNQGDESAKWKGVRGPMFKKFLATARIS